MTETITDEFQVADIVTWRQEYEPKSFMGSYGLGPFKALHVADAERYCMHQGAHERNPEDCDELSVPSHPQSITIGDTESGEFVGILSGAHLKKVTG